MRRPYKLSSSPLPFLGILAGLSLAQTALAGSDEPGTSAAGSSPAAEVQAPRLTGPQVYNTVCIACHAPPGVGGAPALGNVEAWTPRIAQGMDTLVAHALNGFSGATGIMPRKGERPDLSDDEVIAAVRYMVEQATPSQAAEK